MNVCRSFEVAHSRVGESPSSSDSESSSRSESDSESIAEGPLSNPANNSVKAEVNVCLLQGSPTPDRLVPACKENLSWRKLRFFSLVLPDLSLKNDSFCLCLTAAHDFGKSFHTSANRNCNLQLTPKLNLEKKLAENKMHWRAYREETGKRWDRRSAAGCQQKESCN